jgi:hypothetical protein
MTHTACLVFLVRTLSGCHKNALRRGITCSEHKTKLEQSTFLRYLWFSLPAVTLRSHRRNSSKMIINYEVKQCLIFIHLYVNKRYGWNVYQKRDKKLCANFSMLVRPFKQTGGWRGQQVTSQGSLTEREYSVQFTSLSQLFKYSSFFHGNIVYLFYETGYLNEEVNCTDPSHSVSIPWSIFK